LPRLHYLLWAFVPPALLNAVIILQPWFDPRLVYVDPLAAAELAEKCCSRSFGFASSIGVLYWAAAAACCGLAAAALWRGTTPRAKVRMLTTAALFTGFLCLDDLFMLHESVLPRLGVPEIVTFGSYALIAGAYLAINWRLIRTEEPLLFLLSLGCLALSVLVDRHGHDGKLWLLILEEGSKLMGVAGWSTYHIRRAYGALRAA
jgi:hypothetical protein